MKAQTPAVGISAISIDDDTESYHIECTCTDPDHAHDACVEVDSDGTLSVSIYGKATTKFWEVSRWKQIWSILTTGTIETNSTLLLSKQAALNYADALRKSIENLEQ